MAGITQVDKGSTFIQIRWAAAQDNESGVKSYTAVYTRGSTPPASCSSGTRMTIGQDMLHARASGLRRLTVYSFRVCATNKAGLVNGGVTVSQRTNL